MRCPGGGGGGSGCRGYSVMIYMYSICSVYVGKFSNRRKEMSKGCGATPWHLIGRMVYDSDLGLICVDIQ